MKVTRFAAAWLGATLGVLAPCHAQEPATAEAPSRQIAPVMSHVHADWLTRPEREQEEQPDRLVAALKIPRGSTVIDFGAGVGYFTWRLARRVGSEGKVLAVDIQPEMLEMLSANMRKRKIRNVETVLGTAEDPRLPENVADLVLLVDVYHELAYPRTTLEHLRRSLKSDGRLVVVEYRKENPWIPIHPLHKMTVKQVRNEIEPAGYEFLKLMNFLPSQHVVIFTPRKE